MGYSKEVDGDLKNGATLSDVCQHIKATLRASLREKKLRRLLAESMGYEGFFKAVKDYLQPILESAALPAATVLFSGLIMTNEQKSVILIGPVYLLLYTLSAYSSRRAYLFIKISGDENSASHLLWGLLLGVLLILIPAMYFGITWMVICCFVIMYILQNLWRPVLMSRIDSCSDENKGATILSIESQAKSLSTMIIAPLIGFLVDLVSRYEIGSSEFWPLAVIGSIIAVIFFGTRRREVKAN